MVLRFYGFMVLRFYGFMVLWFYGFMVLWFYGFEGQMTKIIPLNDFAFLRSPLKNRHLSFDSSLFPIYGQSR
jgi:hypothetical protein